MRNVFINNDGLLAGPYITDATIEIEVSDAEAEKISSLPFNRAWKFNSNTHEFYLIDLLDENRLKDRRERECFKIIDNRSQMWYNRLTEEQKQELNTWYEAWLNVTETKIIPEKPEWLE